MDNKNNQLLIKQRDYEFEILKRKIKFKRSIYDPLINPNKIKNKKIKRNNNNNIFNNNNNKFNPLTSKVSKINQQFKNNNSNKINQKSIIQDNNNNIDNKIQTTPWKIILTNFIKIYDINQKQISNIKISNPFGNQGLKIQAQIQSYASSSQTNQGQNNNNISIKTYMRMIKGLKKDLKIKWQKNDKVGGLQIAIQACKLLHDTSNAKFQAVKFAYAIQIIQQFGINVFERIKSLSFPHLSSERLNQLNIQHLQGANIPQSAQQICRNWLLKISSIRQLIPRVIIETTLLRLHFFMDGGIHAKKVVQRLGRTNRCFGEYINCIFFATFLIRMGRQVLPQDNQYILDILDDVFFYIKQGKTKFSRTDITYDEFFKILEPFFITSFQSLAENLDQTQFKRFCKILPQNPHPIILNNFISSFSPSLLINFAIDIAHMLQKIYKQYKYSIYINLLTRLSGIIFAQSNQFILLVWTDINQIDNIEILLNLLGPFSQIIFRNLPRYQMNKFYTLILDKFNNLFQNFIKLSSSILNSFQNFITNIVEKTENIKDILTLQPFLQIIAYFPKQNKKNISQNIIITFISRNDQKIQDPLVVHIMLSLAKNLQGQHIKPLILKFMFKIEFNDDLQQALNFYCEMRANFSYIQQVIIALIYKAAKLTFKARTLAKGRITKKLISFLQAVIAYCFITVPVLENPKIKLQMYLYLSEIALCNNLISQSTSLIKTCISNLAELDAQSDIKISNIFTRIISFLIVMPDDPQNSYLFLLNGLLQAFSIARFKTNYESIVKLRFYTEIIQYLNCQSQQKLPFHLQGVVSNDGLYKSVDFQQAILQKLYEMIECIENSLTIIVSMNCSEIDSYTISTMCQCLMNLMSIFQETLRFKKIVKAFVKVLQIYKDRIVKSKYGLPTLNHTNLKGLNLKLSQKGYKVQIK